MSEEKLTVAELMARAAKEGHGGDAPRSRRRRRSLEEGGVSVAELTGSIPAVKDKPVESRHSSVPIDAPTDTPVAETPEPQQPAEPSVPSEPLEQPQQPQQPQLKVVPAAKEKPVPEASKREPERHTPSDDETMVISIVDEKDPIRLTTGAFPVVPASAEKQAVVAGTGQDHLGAEAAAEAEFADSGAPTDLTGELEAVSIDEEEEEGRGSILSIILMALVGVVLGVLVFLGFQILWERLDRWIVSILAIAVTLGGVGVIHALRTSRDGFSMVLAALVGLVMTFGPLATVL
ncbi:hypothetical protein [Corynebacterium pacaense]|uniref:hypothetical protein n=1 Tax=Corynebacterium pacaense TaxID=1816684 RepID=UPI0009B9325C|nr:hypothetical protein [Corynebacterium pacaense]